MEHIHVRLEVQLIQSFINIMHYQVNYCDDPL